MCKFLAVLHLHTPSFAGLLECLESSRAHRRQQQQETNEILKTSCSSRRQEEEEAASGKDNLICKLNRKTDRGSF